MKVNKNISRQIQINDDPKKDILEENLYPNLNKAISLGTELSPQADTTKSHDFDQPNLKTYVSRNINVQVACDRSRKLIVVA